MKNNNEQDFYPKSTYDHNSLGLSMWNYYDLLCFVVVHLIVLFCMF